MCAGCWFALWLSLLPTTAAAAAAVVTQVQSGSPAYLFCRATRGATCDVSHSRATLTASTTLPANASNETSSPALFLVRSSVNDMACRSVDKHTERSACQCGGAGSGRTSGSPGQGPRDAQQVVTSARSREQALGSSRRTQVAGTLAAAAPVSSSATVTTARLSLARPARAPAGRAGIFRIRIRSIELIVIDLCTGTIHGNTDCYLQFCAPRLPQGAVSGRVSAAAPVRPACAGLSAGIWLIGSRTSRAMFRMDLPGAIANVVGSELLAGGGRAWGTGVHRRVKGGVAASPGRPRCFARAG